MTKKAVFPILFFLFAASTWCQVAPPAAYPANALINNIHTWTPASPVSDASSIPALSLRDVKQTTQYLDGLGRPLQTVSKQLSPMQKDIVSAITYDQYGREVYKYLPFVSTSSDGTFKSNPFQQQSAFYSDPNGILKGQGETYFYGQTDYEFSPLNRVNKSMAPGNNWTGANRGKQLNNWSNVTNDDVKMWSVTDVAGSFGSYAITGVYPAGQLYKMVSVDENGNQVIEFKDLSDKVILKKVQLSASSDGGSGSGYPGWMCTYYIYDNLNNLRCIIQPHGVELIIAQNWLLTDPGILSEQCFRYEYDGRQRMIMKKVPGSAEMEMLYDQRDRLIYSQDGNLNAKGWWMTSLYDAYNRQVATGMTYNTSRSQLQSFLDDPAFNFGTGSLSVQGAIPIMDMAIGNRELSRQKYQASKSITFNPGFQSEDNATFTAEIISGGSPSTLNVSGSSLPSGASFIALTETFYDNYSFTAKTYDNSDLFKLGAGASPSPETLPSSASILTTGLMTGSKVWMMDDPNNLSAGRWLESVSFYDDKGRVVQVQSDNCKGGIEKSNTRFDFSGKVNCNYTVHNNPSSTLGNIRIKSNFDYDPNGRLITIMKQINDDATTNKIIIKNSYDELGQSNTKQLGANPVNTSLPLETLTYDYNIRGWLLGANRDFARTKNTITNYFGFDLGYDKATINPSSGSTIGSYATPAFNGNIGGMLWKSRGDDEIRKYDFNYDAANRLLKADFNQYTSSTFNKSANVDFSVTMGDGVNGPSAYDANGNIQSINQMGLKVTASSPIDQLVYSYQTASNKLNAVTDGANDNASTLGDFKYDPATKGSTDYTYDVNGNLTADNNKKISSIVYDHLNLPTLITVTGKGTIQYIYDASGIKLQKITTDNTVSPSKIITTTYIGGYVYQNDTLQFTSHEEGRIRYKPLTNSFVYDYFLKDHLGNVRMLLTEDPQVDIYPAATLEPSKIATEQLYYTINTSQVVDKSTVTGLPAYNNNNTIPNPPVNSSFDNANSTKLYVLNKNTQKTGLGITLRVMSGDKLDIYGKSYYFTNNSGGTPANSPVTTLDILNGLLGGPSGSINTSIHGNVTPTQLNGNTGSTLLLNTLFNSQTNNNNITPQVPKAFINYVLFDDQFKCVGSGFAPVGANSQLTDYASATTLHNIAVNKNGFVYIYCSNESPVDVFFDNLQVVHSRGPILEETHYYPFGLTMAGISCKAAGGVENKKKKFQGQEYNDDLGVDVNEFKYRMDDPQTGRFWQIDPLAEKYDYNSTYAFSEDKVTSHVELEGLEAVDIRGLVEKGVRENSTNVTNASVGAVMNSYDAGQVKGGMIAATGFKVTGIGLLMVFQPEIGFPLAVADITGMPVNGAPTSVVETAAASELSTATSTIEKNAAQGAAFEQKVGGNLATAGDTKIAPQITIKADNGVKTRVDFISSNKSGQLSLTEAKSSSTAPLTGNQKVAFPSIAQNGGVIVGNGKPGYPGGTVIPPTQINIVRPSAIDNTYVRPNIPIIPLRKNQN